MSASSERSCCHTQKPDHDHGIHTHEHSKRFDPILYGSLFAIIVSICANLLWEQSGGHPPVYLHHFAHTCIELLSTMWWGIALGIVIVGLMSKIPRDLFTAIMGRGDHFSGLLRAVFAGIFLDLCCHGILLVAAKLYERGVSLAQVVTFLVASPWNSLSLTLILITLIGLKWTLLYILGSVIVALASGLIFQLLLRTGKIPANPNRCDTPDNYKVMPEIKSLLSSIKFTRANITDVLRSGWTDGKMIIKWLLFGVVIAASIRTFVPADIFTGWFGPTFIGLIITIIAATVIEICSEGSAPIAGELFSQAGAPGNGFAFLMAGVATDYTEIMAVREFTKSWKIALLLPLVTVPQVVLLGWIMNMASLP